MKLARLACAALASALAASCAASTPPPGWQQGGAPLFLPRAAWNAGPTSVELLQDGRVLVNGTWSFRIDAAGRVVDAEGQPVALLRPDGRLVGGGGEDLGTVGPVSAAAPGSRYATVAIAPDGRVLVFGGEADGESSTTGAWTGCGLYAQSLQACMLVTYLVSTRFRPYRALQNGYPGSGFGTPYLPGFGLGVP